MNANETESKMPAAPSTVAITGNTYPVKDALRALGGRWNPTAKAWMVPAAKASEARALVDGAPAPVSKVPASGLCSCGRRITGNYAQCYTCANPGQGYRGRKWSPCGYPGCSPHYCDECDGEGYRPGR
jgi:hypothetical protein